MPHRSAAEIESECNRLLSFAVDFLNQLPNYRSSSPEYYQRKAKILLDYQAPSPSIKLRGLRMAVGDLLEMTDDLGEQAVLEIDASLASCGRTTLSAMRKEMSS